MNAYSYSATDPSLNPRSNSVSAGRYDAAGRFARPAGIKNSIALYRATSLSDTALEKVMIAQWIPREGAYTSDELERALVEAALLQLRTPRALDLLEHWRATPSHRPNKYWEELQAELAANRLTPAVHLAQRFQQLAQTWRKECATLSSIRDIATHPAYQEIVGMGRSAVPLILRELEKKPDHWFWALRSITEQDPVPPEHRGNVPLMAQDWLQWARGRGFRW